MKNNLEKMNKLLFELKRICNNYRRNDENKMDVGFNAFTLASEFYYRENFHSYIIKALIDSKEKHNEKTKFLFLFIDMLNKVRNESDIQIEPINKYDFINSTVHREKDNIDILIINENIEAKKKAIIIENKINKAEDQNKQLPNYYNTLENKYKADVVAIVYIVPDSSKKPDKKNWTPEEVIIINKVLKIIPACSYSDNETNLLADWINPAILSSTNIDASNVLRQYGNLLKYLHNSRLDMESMEQFYNKMIESKDNYETVFTIQEMLKKLPFYLAQRLKDKYSENFKPFECVRIYNEDRTVFSDFVLNKNTIRLSIWCGISNSDEYKLFFYDINGNEINKVFKDKIDILSTFHYDEKENSFIKTISLFEENVVIETLDKILDSLRNLNE